MEVSAVQRVLRRKKAFMFCPSYFFIIPNSTYPSKFAVNSTWSCVDHMTVDVGIWFVDGGCAAAAVGSVESCDVYKHEDKSSPHDDDDVDDSTGNERHRVYLMGWM